MSFFRTVSDNLSRRAAYRRTRRELRSMPLDVALDLDIDRADAGRIARASVYGR